MTTFKTEQGVRLFGRGFPIPGKCVLCPTEIPSVDHFKDKLSLKEFGISGLCQKCQDSVFDA